MKTVETLGDLCSKRVLVRSDFNVPLKDGKVTDDGRIRAALPTLTRLAEAGAKVVIMARLGRPKGKVGPAFSLAPIAKRLGELIDAPVILAKDVADESAKATVEALRDGETALLENVRYDACETSKVDEEHGELAAAYAELGDVFVSDDFGVVYHKQASVYDIVKLLPSASGPLVFKEIESLRKATDNPKRPYGAAFGGSKAPDKLGVIANLLKKTGRLFIGGDTAFTSPAAQGHPVGRSSPEEEQIDTVKGYIAEAAERGVELVLPIDVVAAPEFAADVSASVVTVDQILVNQMGFDTGSESCKLFAEKISPVRTVAWNGPMGVFEFPALAEDTKVVIKALLEGDMFLVIGGGDFVAAVRLLDFDESTSSHISVGDGASLELLGGKALPGIAVLED